MAHNRPQSGGDPIADRRVKLDRLRTELNAEPYGQRVDDLMSLADARNLYNSDKVDDDRAAIPGPLHQLFGQFEALCGAQAQ